MKANWKLALMCAATLAFVFGSCKPKNNPDKPGGGDDPEEEYVNPISIKDNSLADWDALPADYVFEAKCPSDAAYLGLKKVKVYADALYINIIAEYDEEEIVDLTSVPFHVYINTDNSDATGGYGDQFLDANTDILMEGFFFADEAACEYTPDVYPWVAEVGGSGWGWAEAPLTAGDFCHSQHVGKCVEIQMLRELIPSDAGWNADEFGIGFDIQQAWESVGILPLVSPTDENATGHANKLQVKIKK